MVQLSLKSPSDPSAEGGTTLVLSEGVETSWDELYSELGPALIAYARSRGVRDPEDLAQDVFVDAYRYRHHFSGDGAQLRSLFFTIAYRRISDFHRRRGRRPETLVPRPEDVDVPSTPASPSEDHVVSADTASFALRALSILSEREQVVIRMRVIEELSSAVVARRLGLSNANVRVIQARALSKVRAFLATQGSLRHPLAGAMLLASLRYTGGRLPAKGPIGGWIRDLKTSSANPRRPNPGSRPPSAVHEVVDKLCCGGSSLVTQLGTMASRVGIGVVLVTGFALAWTPESPSARADAATAEQTWEESISLAPDPTHAVDPETDLSDGGKQVDRTASAPADEIHVVASPSPTGPGELVDPRDGLLTSTLEGAVDMLAETTSSLLGARRGLVSSTLSSAAGTAEGLLETTVKTAEDLTEAVGDASSVDLSDEAVSTVGDEVHVPVEEVAATVEEASGASGEILHETGDEVTEVLDEDLVDPLTSLLGG